MGNIGTVGSSGGYAPEAHDRVEVAAAETEGVCPDDAEFLQRMQHEAISYLVTAVIASTSTSSDGNNPNNPDFVRPWYGQVLGGQSLVRPNWESSVSSEVGHHRSAYGMSITGSRGEVSTLVREALHEHYRHANADDLDVASEHIVEQLWAAHEAVEHHPPHSMPNIPWGNRICRETPMSDVRGGLAIDDLSARLDQRTVAERPGAGNLIEESATARLALGAASRIVASLNIPAGATVTAGGVSLGALGTVQVLSGAAAAPLFILGGLSLLGQANLEGRELQAFNGERNGLAFGLGHALARLDPDTGELPDPTSFEEEVRSQFASYNGGNPADAEAFDRGLEAAQDMLEELSPEQRMELRGLVVENDHSLAFPQFMGGGLTTVTSRRLLYIMNANAD